MERPGRNDPCYCGSGKKYKQCHMAADLAADREQRAWADAARELRIDLFDFADEERFDAAAGEAAAHYWDGYYTAETLPQMSPSETERFLDWLIFDYTLPEGSRIADAFRAENAGDMSPLKKQLFDEWAGGPPMGGYELTGYEKQTLRLKEILSGRELELFEPAGHGNATTGAIILGRPVKVQDHYEFFSMPAFIPTGEIADLRDKLAAARAADDSGDDSEFMRRHNVLLIHHALEQAKAAGRPPVARLDERHNSADGNRQRARHERIRIKGPAGVAENAPQQIQSHRKAI